MLALFCVPGTPRSRALVAQQTIALASLDLAGGIALGGAAEGASADDAVAAGDEALLGAIIRQDRDALGALYDRHGGAALGLAYRIVCDRQVAEEIVQDAFVAVWHRASTYSPTRGEAKTWLLAIVRHRAIDHLRRRPPAEMDLVWAEASPAVDDVSASVALTLTRQEIESALSGLPPEQRQAIELGFFGGLTHGEIAEQTGAPLGTIKGRMRLGLRRLRGRLVGSEQTMSASV